MSFRVGTPTLQVAMAYTPLISDHKKNQNQNFILHT